MSVTGVPSGLKGFLLFKRNEDGIAMGNLSDPDDVDVSGGAVTTHAVWFDIPISLGAPSITRTKQTALYGQKFRGTFDLGVESIADTPLTIGQFDSILNGMLTGVSTNTSNWSGYETGGEDINASELSNIGIISEQGFQDYVNGVFTAKKMNMYYAGQIAQNAANASQDGGTNPNAPQYSFSPVVYSRIFTGQQISTLHPNDTNVERIRYPMKGKHSIGITTCVFDDTATTFTTNYKPLFDDEGVGERNLFVIWDPVAKTATPTTLTSVNTSSGLITLTGNPGEGKIGILVYPTNRIAV
jgi:hypothetical protein